MRTSKKILAMLLIAGSLSLAMAASASANTYWARVNGADTGTCAAANPCHVERAALLATAPGDDISVLPGTHIRKTTNGYMSIADNVTIHAAPGKAKPTIKVPSELTCACAVIQLNPGATARDIEIEYPYQPDGGNHPAPIVMDGSANLDGVRATGYNDAVYVYNGGTGKIERSVLHTTGPLEHSALAVFGTTTNTTINVVQSTLYGFPSASHGVNIRGEQGSGVTSTTINFHNSVVRGGVNDIDLTAGATKTAGATFDHSNVDLASAAKHGVVANAAVTDSGNNNSAAPQFQNSALGNFHPTDAGNLINGGSAPFPSTDFDGREMPTGGLPDIGAFEFGPAPPALSEDDGFGNGTTPPPPATPAAKTLAGVKISVKAKRKKGKLSAKVTCPKAAVGSCTGTLSVKQGKKTRSATVKAIKPGKSATIKIKAKKGKASITVTLTDGSGASGSTTASKKLR